MSNPTCDQCDCVAGCQSRARLCPNLAEPEPLVLLSAIAQPVTPFGKTHLEHLESSLKWLDSRRERLHHEGCCYHTPSAQCNCGLHQCITDIRAVINSTKEAIAQPKDKP